jgi:glutaminyl-peptide cyclotransferase
MSRILFLLLLLGGPAAQAAPPVAFPAEEAWSYLTAQCEMGPRNPGSAGHARCGAWIAARLEEWGYEVERHAFQYGDPYGEGELSLLNLRAFRPGEGGRSPAVALGAHWDTRPWAEMDPDSSRGEEPILGANDGASGVAVLLAMAKLCAETRPRRPVEFLFFDGEDYGKPGQLAHYIIGSRRFVRDHPEYRPGIFILLDMVAGKGMRIPMEGYSMRISKPQTDALYSLAESLGLSAFERRVGASVLDDHIPFLQAGIPSVDLIDLSYAEWHTHADLPAACSTGSLQQVGTLLVHYLYE